VETLKGREDTVKQRLCLETRRTEGWVGRMMGGEKDDDLGYR